MFHAVIFFLSGKSESILNEKLGRQAAVGSDPEVKHYKLFNAAIVLKPTLRVLMIFQEMRLAVENEQCTLFGGVSVVRIYVEKSKRDAKGANETNEK